MQQLLAALVAVPTQNPPATEYATCVELLISTGGTLVIDTDRCVAGACAGGQRYRDHRRAPGVRPCPGLLEIRFYVERGVPALAYGPGVLAVSHGLQEFVKISRMVECAKIYTLTAARMLGPR